MEPTTTKSGIWTEHCDAHGRTYYFNMVHGRSYWTLPDELLAVVQRPAPDAARAWDPVPLAHDEPPEAGTTAPHKQPKQAAQHAASSTITSTTSAATTFSSAAPGIAALQERMAVAAQRKKQSELKRLADEKQQQQHPSDKQDTGAPQDAYLAMVRQLEQSDNASESTGNKWLVR